MTSKTRGCCSRISQKWVFAVMSFFGIFCAFAVRMSLSLTIPKMVTPIEHKQEFYDDTCPDPNFNITNISMKNVTNSVRSDTYDWSEYTQGIILGSFYWGFVLSHLPGGMIAERFGGKHTFGIGIFITAIITMLTPLIITWGGSTSLIYSRVIMGLFEGVTQPAMSVMLAQWIPAEERSKISSFVYMGATFGILFISMGLGPIIRSMDWHGVYYLFGGIGVIWYLLWCVLCYNNPREHPFISEEEAKELNEKLKEYTHSDAPPVPWRHLLTSSPFWALVIVSIGRDWGGYTIMTDLPKYTMGVLKYTVDENGLVFLVSHTAIFTACILFSWMSDWLIEKDYMSRTNVRKVMCTIGMALHGIFCLLGAYVGCNKLQYFVISFLSAFTAGAGFPGIKANVLDLSPNYAGTVMAISHGLAGLCGIGGPYIVGVIAPNQTLAEWRLIFWIIFIVNLATNLAFILFASGEVQEWNDPNFERKKKKIDTEDVQQVEKLLTLQKIQIVTTAEDQT